MSIRRRKLRISASTDLVDAKTIEIAVEIIWPSRMNASGTTVAFVCLPGGGMNRTYFDLAADGDNSFSFASAMAEQGMMTVSIDHLGIGESDRPSDGYALTADRIAQANAQVVDQILRHLRNGTVANELGPLTDLMAVGVGHSMGAMLTVLQQARRPAYDAVILLGFGGQGLISYLPKEAHHLVNAPDAAKSEVEALARNIYDRPYSQSKPSATARQIFYGEKADRDGVSALQRARDVQLMVAGLQSMIPGSFAPELEKIAVPVFIGLGDSDIVGRPHDTPAIFPNSRDITLFILPETGHCHFIFPSRQRLFGRIGEWAAGLCRLRTDDVHVENTRIHKA